MIPILYSDADNTLWETDAVYRRAHMWLFSEIVNRLGLQPEIDDPIEFVRDVDQALADSHPDHLGYPPRLLVRTLVMRLAPVGAPVCREDLELELETEFTRLIRELPELRAGVIDGLNRLHSIGCPVHVMTEGNVESCKRRLMHYSLLDYVQSVDKVIKDEAHFVALQANLPADSTGWVVGDLLSRDIMPAWAAGFKTIYFPGTFSPKWENDLRVPPGVVTVKSFAAVPSIIKNVAAPA